MKFLYKGVRFIVDVLTNIFGSFLIFWIKKKYICFFFIILPKKHNQIF